MYDSFAALRDFGTRSLVTHTLMAVTFVGALVSAFVGGDLGLVSFVAFVNFTAGVWVSQSIHSLGHSFEDDAEYEGVLAALRGQ